MNFIDSFCSNIKKVIALIALMLLLTLVILIFTHTSLGYFLVLLPLTLLIIYLLHRMKKLDEQACFSHSVFLAVLAFILVLCGLPKEGVLLSAVVYAAQLLYTYTKLLKPQEEEQQYNKVNNIEADSADDYVPLITYDDTCPDDGEDYGPEGSVIWGPRTIEENICINGKWYINENSEEWEENEGC
ncbi:hypothetical protein KAH19_00445 [Phascolarctobacterium sp. Marseille-Q4147]|uniref:hypothetical protein n=1 Tax=Phascolarctobacterium sp. Marseille-Q4147 TaxID=2823317 RepID=UPI001B341700|nr:hypothetical protein [Phascolarctobacterium sp. Marseille-Q4147]QTV77878.1 hypothetical protein KAH19_00445 [Phascolarctobacterium sp. Marseille-Q4147]